MHGLLNVIDRWRLREALERFGERQGVPSELVFAALERPLLRDGRCFTEVATETLPAPYFPSPRHPSLSGTVYAFSEVGFGDVMLCGEVNAFFRFMRESQQRDADWLVAWRKEGSTRKFERVQTLKLLGGMCRKALAAWEEVDRSAVLKVMRSPGYCQAGTTEIVRFEDGWRWLRLWGQDAIQAEGAALKNCLRNTYGQLRGALPGHDYYSLRDATNKPRELVAVVERRVAEHRTVCNARPGAKNLWRLRQLEATVDVLPTFETDADGILEIAGKRIALDVPAASGLVIPGHLIIGSTSDVRSLPNALTVEGSLLVSAKTLLRIGRDVSVGGRLLLAYCCCLHQIGSGLRVGAKAEIKGALVLPKLPDRLHVGGALHVDHSLMFRRMGRRTVIVGKLELSRCERLEALPDDLDVGGRIKLLATAPSMSDRLREQVANDPEILW